MDSLYMQADGSIISKIGEKLKAVRLKQNITQQSLAEASGVTLSTVKRMENGEIGAFSSLIRVLRVLGLLDYIQPLTEEEQLSPQEYYNLVHSAQKKSRKRAIGKLNIKDKEDTGW